MVILQQKQRLVFFKQYNEQLFGKNKCSMTKLSLKIYLEFSSSSEQVKNSFPQDLQHRPLIRDSIKLKV